MPVDLETWAVTSSQRQHNLIFASHSLISSKIPEVRCRIWRISTPKTNLSLVFSQYQFDFLDKSITSKWILWVIFLDRDDIQEKEDYWEKYKKVCDWVYFWEGTGICERVQGNARWSEKNTRTMEEKFQILHEQEAEYRIRKDVNWFGRDWRGEVLNERTRDEIIVDYF